MLYDCTAVAQTAAALARSPAMTRVTHPHIELVAMARRPASGVTNAVSTKCVVPYHDRDVFDRHHERASEHWLLPRCFAEEYSTTCCTYVCTARQLKLNRHQSPGIGATS